MKRHNNKQNIPNIRQNLRDIKPVTTLIAQQKKYLDSMANAKTILSKYNKCETSNESWLISTARAILAEPIPQMCDHGFTFEPTKSTAKNNHKLLQKFDFNLQKFIAQHPNSIISPGAEFRPATTLEKFYTDMKIGRLLKPS